MIEINGKWPHPINWTLEEFEDEYFAIEFLADERKKWKNKEILCCNKYLKTDTEDIESGGVFAISPDLWETQIAEFKEFFSKIIPVLDERYGKGCSEIHWGIITYWS